MEQFQHYLRVAQHSLTDVSMKAKRIVEDNVHIHVDHVHVEIPPILKSTMNIRGKFNIAKPYLSLLLIVFLDVISEMYFSLITKSKFDVSRFVNATPYYLGYWLVINFSCGDFAYKILKLFNIFIVIESAYYDAHGFLHILKLLDGMYDEQTVYVLAVLKLTLYFIVLSIIADLFGIKNVGFGSKLTRNIIGALICYGYKNYSEYMIYGDVQTTLVTFFILFELFEFIFKKLSLNAGKLLRIIGFKYHGYHEENETIEKKPTIVEKNITPTTNPIKEQNMNVPKLNQKKEQNENKKLNETKKQTPKKKGKGRK